MKFKLKSDYHPMGDQPQAIKQLVQGINDGKNAQVLLGVTGSGKTFTIANVIEKTQRPVLVIAHNKTLAAQLYQEFREFFPQNAVSYFVSYYDYYQPEAYIARTDTYIEKETEINEEIDKLRLQATTNLLTRRDVIVVASVSSIYNIGNPQEYSKYVLNLEVPSPSQQSLQGQALQTLSRQDILMHLIDLHYDRSQYELHRGMFRVKGDTIDIYPSYEDYAVRIELQDDRINKIFKIESVSGNFLEQMDKFVLYPAKHFMSDPAKHSKIFKEIRQDLEKRVNELKAQDKELEAHRLNQRVNYDLEMIAEIGFVNGIENYSRYFDGRKPGEAPYSLLEYFSKDYLLVIDESHMTIPQIRGMYNGDRARKQTLVDFGFRLPAALDNRPLRFDEFQRRQGQTIYVSATPDDWEREQAKGVVVEQLIRPTGIIDPQVEIRKTAGQIPDLIEEIKKRVAKGQRILVTTLTKRMAEELTDYLKETKIPRHSGVSSESLNVNGKSDAGHLPAEASAQAGASMTEENIKVAYLHSDIQTLDRSSILKKLRLGEHDVLVGINLLREGLDLPEVGLVAILDADKEGFLRSEVSLIQTMGRAARNIDSKVILYADTITGSIKRAVKEVRRRRKIQTEWNVKNNFTPTTIFKPIREDVINESSTNKSNWTKKSNSFSILMDTEIADINPQELLPEQKKDLANVLERRMKEAAKILDFEGATFYRDYLKKLV